METPVLYFYTPRPMTVSVGVDFPKGWITEWFPRASTLVPKVAEPKDIGGGRIEWNAVAVSPYATPELPKTQGASHYYTARNTDAAPIRVGTDWEKLIFYRGVGNFEAPVRPVFHPDGKLEVTADQPVPLVIWFENRGGNLAYRMARNVEGSVTLEPPAQGVKLDTLLTELTDYLVEFGLYRKEAEAMVATWRDSWFETGSRVFYIEPRSRVDELLPLRISPAPVGLARVFVGRSEVLAPWIQTALRTGDAKQFGRFAAPFLSALGLPPARLPYDPNACVQ
jgi:hypothetical protein